MDPPFLTESGPVSSRLVSLTFDATDPVRLARFWASALGWEIADESGDELGVVPTDGTRFIFVFVRVPEAKTAKNPIDVEVVSESIDTALIALANRQEGAAATSAALSGCSTQIAAESPRLRCSSCTRTGSERCSVLRPTKRAMARTLDHAGARDLEDLERRPR